MPLRITILRAVIRLAYTIGLLSLSLRDYIFGNGLYVYRDWTWPLSASLPPVAHFSPEIARNVGPDPMGFVRAFITWPILIIDNLTGSPVLAEKAYIIYFFALFSALFFVFGELLLRLFRKGSGDELSVRKREAFVLFVVLFCFVNFWSLEQFSGLYFTYVVEFALIGISATLVLLEDGYLRAALLPGALLALCIFLDPNLYPYGLLVVAITTLGRSLTRPRTFVKFRSGLARVLGVLVASLPALVTML